MATEGGAHVPLSYLWLGFAEHSLLVTSGQCVVPGAGFGPVTEEHRPRHSSGQAWQLRSFPLLTISEVHCPCFLVYPPDSFRFEISFSHSGSGPLVVLRFDVSDLVLRSALMDQRLEVLRDSSLHPLSY